METSPVVVTCPVCGSAFEKRRPWQVFCGTHCRNLFHHQERKAALAEYRKKMSGTKEAGNA